MEQINKVRAVFISDVHIGMPEAHLSELLNTLKYLEFEYLYLVGDMIDGWKLKRKFAWPANANTLMQKVLRLSRKGVKVVYTYGNHDDFLEQFVGESFGGVEVVETVMHKTLRGENILILHGQQFDGFIGCAKWLQILGSVAYDTLLSCNHGLNKIRKLFGLNHWSVSQWLKSKTKSAIGYINNFEKIVADYAKSHKADAVLCGHIHQPCISKAQAVAYYNCGDWVENCSYLVETLEGEIELRRATSS